MAEETSPDVPTQNPKPRPRRLLKTNLAPLRHKATKEHYADGPTAKALCSFVSLGLGGNALFQHR